MSTKKSIEQAKRFEQALALDSTLASTTLVTRDRTTVVVYSHHPRAIEAVLDIPERSSASVTVNDVAGFANSILVFRF